MGHWYACYTRPRHEFKSCKILQVRGFETLLPTYKTLSKRKDRKRILELPLFPSYIFVNSEPGRFHWILSVPGVVYIVGNSRGPVPLKPDEVSMIFEVTKIKENVMPAPYFKEGDKVRIIKGSLKGMTGFVKERIDSKRKVVLNVETISAAFSVVVDEDAIEKF